MYDVIVIGAGHAGVEAALIAAKQKKHTLILSISLDAISLMACNPNIGGTGKGHLVREIDALGGMMGIAADHATIQSKMLNTAKGPAVHSLRAQMDKRSYHVFMKQCLEDQEYLDLRQGEVINITKDDTFKVELLSGITIEGKTVILATGTYLKSSVFLGHKVIDIGPSGFKNCHELSKSIESLGHSLRRFKTGTPARIHKDSVDYSKLTLHPGDDEIVPFSFLHDSLEIDQIPCFLGYTNEETHRIIEENIEKSALFSGLIEGTGPRYCPSIEDKITRFKDKPRHQLFLEPEGIDTKELYVQGMSTSLPEDVQESFLKSIDGLENVKIMRPGYAIEYDSIDPTTLKLSLESRFVEGLFFAGQINGSSGYEEAAAQGLIAGINAVCYLEQKEPLILRRDQAYIGVLIDDLVTKGTNEPFRMMTSRCEYRLILRQDNADERLTPIAHERGLVSEERYQRLLSKREKIEAEKKRLKETKVSFLDANPILKECDEGELQENTNLYQLLTRSKVTYEKLKTVDPNRPNVQREIIDGIEVELKYRGYIDKQLKQVEHFRSLEEKKIPPIDYDDVKGLLIEARQKLKATMPENIGQASRISGVNPSDIQVLLLYLEHFRSKHDSK
ncbi:tRNA uridine-5-carboxymethylaminomethyl(34) synthesis enzyme MnmG [Guggenheimella bovis]